jgi:hypothetical protein
MAVCPLLAASQVAGHLSLELAVYWCLYLAWKKFYKAIEVHACYSVAHPHWMAGYPGLHRKHSDSDASQAGCTGSACGHPPDLYKYTVNIIVLNVLSQSP